MSKKRFIEACLEGDALLEDIDDYIDEWHESDSKEELHDYLGMTFEEYSAWVEDDSVLKLIFNSRENGHSFSELISQNNVEKLVARASTPEEAAKVKAWLIRTGRLS